MKPIAKLHVLFAGCTVLLGLAQGQDRPSRQIVLSGTVDAATCLSFPAGDVYIHPSMDRWQSKDLLTVQCSPRRQVSFGVVRLTFDLDSNWPSSVASKIRTFSFRWGEEMNGLFTHDPGRCSRLAAVLSSKTLKPTAADSAPFREPPELNSSCNPDDLSGMSMEVQLTGELVDHP
jgi:hypothetical protein